MSQTPTPKDDMRAEIYRLCDLCLSDGAIDADQQQLEALLIGHAPALNDYWHYVVDSVNLRLLATAGVSVSPQSVDGSLVDVSLLERLQQSPSTGTAPIPLNAKHTTTLRVFGRMARGMDFRRHPLRLAVTTLTIVAAFWTFWAYLIHAGRSEFSDRTPSDHSIPVATLRATEDCQWPSARKPRSRGERLKAGELLHLLSGVVEVELAQGAHVRVQGPAEFELRSQNQGFLHHGLLVATVPKRAVGFTIDTPTAEIVDRGTEFGVTVAADGTTDVQVLKGLVQMRPSAGTKRRTATPLSAGSAGRVRAPVRLQAPEVETIPFDAARYAAVGAPKSDSRSAVDRNRRWSELVRRHPALVAYYPMNETAGSTVALDATTPAENGGYRSGMTLEAAGPRPPNFPAFEADNTAAKSNGLDDRLEISSLNTLSDTTYSFEVWFNYSDDSKLQYIGGRGMLGDSTFHPYDSVGLNGSRLGFFNGDVGDFNSGSLVTKDTWHHLVYTRDKNEVKVYLDGALKISGTFAIRYAASDRIVVGNRPGNDLALTGSFDELAIYNTALSADEVRWHYIVSRP